MYKLEGYGENNVEVIGMKKKESMKQEEQRSKNKFNNQTLSEKVENQNDTHNAKKEALGPNTKR